MANTTPPRRLSKVVKAAEKAGWTYDTTRAGHPRLSPPPGLRDERVGGLAAPITFAKTASDWRSDKNSIAALRRHGIKV